jgi:hypothetical protein
MQARASLELANILGLDNLFSYQFTPGFLKSLRAIWLRPSLVTFGLMESLKAQQKKQGAAVVKRQFAKSLEKRRYKVNYRGISSGK